MSRNQSQILDNEMCKQLLEKLQTTNDEKIYQAILDQYLALGEKINGRYEFCIEYKDGQSAGEFRKSFVVEQKDLDSDKYFHEVKVKSYSGFSTSTVSLSLSKSVPVSVSVPESEWDQLDSVYLRGEVKKEKFIRYLDSECKLSNDALMQVDIMLQRRNPNTFVEFKQVVLSATIMANFVTWHNLAESFTFAHVCCNRNIITLLAATDSEMTFKGVCYLLDKISPRSERMYHLFAYEYEPNTPISVTSTSSDTSASKGVTLNSFGS